MSKTAFNRDGILSPDERVNSASKCLELLEPYRNEMQHKEFEFVEDMGGKIDRFGCSERQLAWLRDLVSKYAT